MHNDEIIVNLFHLVFIIFRKNSSRCRSVFENYFSLCIVSFVSLKGQTILAIFTALIYRICKNVRLRHRKNINFRVCWYCCIIFCVIYIFFRELCLNFSDGNDEKKPQKKFHFIQILNSFLLASCEQKKSRRKDQG